MSSSLTYDRHQAWLAGRRETAIEPELPIIDAHHHLWTGYGKPVPWQPDYWVDEFARDLSAGHNVIASVFVECGYGYRKDGPAALKPAGEVETIDAFAREFEAKHGAGVKACAGIVGFADLRLGHAVEETLEAQLRASLRRFRGIRQIVNWDSSEEVRYVGVEMIPHLMLDAKFQEGFSRLEAFGLSFDAWLWHPQLADLIALAKKFPYTTIVIDHLGGPLGVGPYAGKRAEILVQWKKDIAALAPLPNTYMKLGGLHMEHAGFHWHERAEAPSSDDFVAASSDYFRHAIDRFGPSRCMFESNAPVDQVSFGYVTLWNALKKISAGYSPAERTAMFSGTARRVYRLGV